LFFGWFRFASFDWSISTITTVGTVLVEKGGEWHLSINTRMIVDTNVNEVSGVGVGMEFGVC